MNITAIPPTKDVMAQYSDIKEEIETLQNDIKSTEDSIAKLIEEGTVVDKVTGGLGGIQGFRIEGFPVKEYDRRKKILRNKMDRLIGKENDLMEIVERVELFIDNIPVSRDRQVFRMLYVEKKTQQQVAKTLHIDRSLVSKIISKYI